MHLPFFLLVMLLKLPVLLPFLLHFLLSVCFSLKVQCSKLSTMHHPTSPAGVKMESFAPIFNGNHIFNLPGFNSLRRLMHFHYVTQDNGGIPMCHTGLNIYFSHLCLQNPLIYPTPVSSDNAMLSLSSIYFFKSILSTEQPSQCVLLVFSFPNTLPLQSRKF